MTSRILRMLTYFSEYTGTRVRQCVTWPPELLWRLFCFLCQSRYCIFRKFWFW